MTPDEARELFSAAFDQELDEAQAPAFAAALAADAELAREYEAFVVTVTQAQVEAASAKVPDLLPAVQRRLRARSRGRFYADRFAERLGSGWLQPVTLAIGMLLLLGLAWLLVVAFSAFSVSPPTP